MEGMYTQLQCNGLILDMDICLTEEAFPLSLSNLIAKHELKIQLPLSLSKSHHCLLSFRYKSKDQQNGKEHAQGSPRVSPAQSAHPVRR
mmetsp:Transcript_31883/g.42388  ORF Transcript_31883/g.42388 Transcript_31883/m.42388 type:complete len:89 (+) Transcript_31883:306-572(+)